MIFLWQMVFQQPARDLDIRHHIIVKGATKMRKITVMVATISFVICLGLVFTQESNAASMYNGITYFDLVPVSTCGNAKQASGGAEATLIMFNGITSFSPIAQGSCAGKKAEESPGSKLYNGITIF